MQIEIQGQPCMHGARWARPRLQWRNKTPLSRTETSGVQIYICTAAGFEALAELLAQQAKSVLALLAPKDVTETRLRVGRVS